MTEKKSKRASSDLPDSEPCLTHSRDKLLKAAFDVFSRSGYQGATTKQISQAAGVNEALISRHFQSKQGLFYAVLEKNIREDFESINYPPADTLEEELLRFASCDLERLSAKKDFIRMVIGQSMVDEDFARNLKEHLGPPDSHILIERLKMHQKEGRLAEDACLEKIVESVAMLVFSTFFFSKLFTVFGEESMECNLRTALKSLSNTWTCP